jgi:hypothetical protein
MKYTLKLCSYLIGLYLCYPIIYVVAALGRPKEVKCRGFHPSDNETSWYTVGLSVVRKQHITFLSAWSRGLSLTVWVVRFYFGLPL